MVEVFGIAFSIMGLLPSIASTLAYSIPAGPVGMVWVRGHPRLLLPIKRLMRPQGWFLASGFIFVVGLAMVTYFISIFHIKFPKLMILRPTWVLPCPPLGVFTGGRIILHQQRLADLFASWLVTVTLLGWWLVCVRSTVRASSLT